jgi:acyl dehydratase
MWFEDFPLNVKITLGSYTFTEENIVSFAKRYDPQAFHVDKEAALRSPYGGLIASGWHTGGGVDEADDGLSACAHRGGRSGHPGELCLAGRAELKWLKPVRPGTTLIYTNEPLCEARLAHAAAIRIDRRPERSTR